jgi:outer membrane lipoprotein LolB
MVTGMHRYPTGFPAGAEARPCAARAAMTWRFRRRSIGIVSTMVLAVALVSGCATRPRVDDRGWRSVDAVRPADVETFRVVGRLAVSDGEDGGSAGFSWLQRDDSYEFELRQPVSQRTWRLTGDRRGAVLEGGDGGPVRGESAESLLSEAVGWRVPVGALAYWVRGLPHPWVRGVPGHGPVIGSDYDDRQRLVHLDQDGWQVEYRSWLDDGVWPDRMVARKGAYIVRLRVQDWSVGE